MSSYICLLLNILFYFVSAVSYENSLRQDEMYLIIEEDIFPIKLIENPLTQRLISILPLKTKLVLKDPSKIKLPLRAHIEVDSLHNTIKDASTIGNKGDVILYKGKEIIILNEFTTLANDSNEYVKIASCENVEELLNRIETNKTIFLWNTLNYESHKGKVRPYGKYSSIMNYFTWKIFTFFCFLLI